MLATIGVKYWQKRWENDFGYIASLYFKDEHKLNQLPLGDESNPSNSSWKRFSPSRLNTASASISLLFSTVLLVRDLIPINLHELKLFSFESIIIIATPIILGVIFFSCKGSDKNNT